MIVWIKCNSALLLLCVFVFFFQAEDGIRDDLVTGVQTCALPIWLAQLVERPDDRLDALIADQSADRDVEIVFLGHEGEAIDLHGWIDDLGFTTVAAPNSLRGVARIGDEIIDADRKSVV